VKLFFFVVTVHMRKSKAYPKWQPFRLLGKNLRALHVNIIPRLLCPKLRDWKSVITLTPEGFASEYCRQLSVKENINNLRFVLIFFKYAKRIFFKLLSLACSQSHYSFLKLFLLFVCKTTVGAQWLHLSWPLWVMKTTVACSINILQ